MFNKVEVEKIIACHISTNPASGRVMVKVGMHYDSTLEGYVVDKNTGKREDLLYYSIDR
jgi:RimJ/RimL family protein N-acetyltransferase